MEKSHLSSSYGLLGVVLAIVTFLLVSGCTYVVINKNVDVSNNQEEVWVDYKTVSQQELKDLLDLTLEPPKK